MLERLKTSSSSDVLQFTPALDRWSRARVTPGLRTKLAITGLLLASFGIAWYGWTSLRPATEQVDLEIDARYLNFGEVLATESFKWDIVVRNRASYAVEILDFKASCVCTEVEPTYAVLNPGADRRFQITVDLTRKIPEDSHREPFAVELLPITNGTSRTTHLRITGVVRYPIMLSPSHLNFGQTLVRGSPFKPASVTVQSDRPFEFFDAQCDAHFASVAIVRKSESRYEVSVTPASEPPTAHLDFPVLLRGSFKGGESVPPMSIRVTGTIVDDLKVDPPIVLFSQRKGSHESLVTVSTRTGRPIHNVIFECSDPNIRVSPHGAAAGEWPRFNVTSVHTTKAFRKSTVIFRTVPRDGAEGLATPLAVYTQPVAIQKQE